MHLSVNIGSRFERVHTHLISNGHEPEAETQLFDEPSTTSTSRNEKGASSLEEATLNTERGRESRPLSSTRAGASANLSFGNLVSLEQNVVGSTSPKTISAAGVSRTRVY